MATTGAKEVFYLVSVCLAFLGLVATALIQFFSWSDTGQNIGMFNWQSDELWDIWNRCLIETDWIFFIWAAVYIVQLPWLFYGITLVCRKTETGHYLYQRPPVMPASIYISFFVSLMFTLAWAFLRDQEPLNREEGESINTYVRISTVAILVAAIASSISLAISVYQLSAYEKELIQKDFPADPWFIRLLVQNSLSSHAYWLSILLFYCIAIMLREEANVDSDTGCYITFSLILLYVITFFIIDIILIIRVKALLILPYIVAIICETGTVFHNTSDDNDSDELHLILAGGLVAVIFMLFIMKMVVYIIKVRGKETEEPYIKPTDESPPPSPPVPMRPTPPRPARPASPPPMPVFNFPTRTTSIPTMDRRVRLSSR